MKSKKSFIYLIIILVLFFISFVIYRMGTTQDVASENMALDKKFEAVELKDQKDFKLTGEEVLSGLGMEPGFNIKMTLAGTKFGVDLNTQNNGRLVGFIDLVSQATNTKIFSGTLLNNVNVAESILMQVNKSICTLPSGDEVDFEVKINVMGEDLDGCAQLK